MSKENVLLENLQKEINEQNILETGENEYLIF